MKYIYSIEKIILPTFGTYKKVRLRWIQYPDKDDLSFVLYHTNTIHLPYYIQEVKKLLEGKRTKELEIHITDDPEYDIPDNYILANKDYTYHPEQPEKKLETTELLEFLQIMAEELQIDQKKVIEPNLDYWTDRYTGGHHLPSIEKGTIIIQDKSELNKYGCYKAKVVWILDYNPKTEEATLVSKKTWNTKDQKTTFFPDNWSQQKVIDKINEAYLSGLEAIDYGKNLYKGYTRENMEIFIRIDFNTGEIIDAYPKY